MLRQGLLFLAAWVLVIAATSVVPHSALAQGTQLLTTWGDPDLNGVWDFRTITPMERPEELADKATLTEEEAAAFAVEASRRADSGLFGAAHEIVLQLIAWCEIAAPPIAGSE